MIVSITQITGIVPVEPGSRDDLNLSENQVMIALLIPDDVDQSGKNEKGKITILAELLSGSPEGVVEVVPITDEPMVATLLRATTLDSGMLELELYFDQIFVTGFETSVLTLLSAGAGLVGLSEMDKMVIDNLDFQRQVFDNLVDVIFDSHKDEIKALPLPCLLMDVVEMNSTSKSCYFSQASIPEAACIGLTVNNEHMMHVATICKSEIAGLLPAEIIDFMPAAYLSFYLEKGGREEPSEAFGNRAQIVLHNEVEWKSKQEKSAGSGIVFRKMLDLPQWDHSVLFNFQFSPIEDRQYEALEKTFKKLIHIGNNNRELNKLFGYSDNIQSCVAYWAEVQFSQREPSDEIYKDAADWQLLLQLSPYKHWFPIFDVIGDASLYFMIRKKDWLEGNFTHVQVIFQNT